MNARRKRVADAELLRAEARKGDQRSFPPQAYDYDGDVSADNLQAVRDRAKVALDEEQWVVIDGYAGDEK